MEACPGCPLTGQQAQQLLAHVLRQLDEAALRREQADMAEAAEAAQRQQACERAWQRRLKRRARRRAQLRKQQERSVQQQAPLASGATLPAPGGTAAAGSSPSLEGLREAAWRAAVDQQAAAEAMMAAWVSGAPAQRLSAAGVLARP